MTDNGFSAALDAMLVQTYQQNTPHPIIQDDGKPALVYQDRVYPITQLRGT